MLIAGLLGAALGLRGGEEDTFRPEDVADMQNEVKAQLDNLVKRLASAVERMERISAEDAEKIRTVEREIRRLDISADMGTVSRRLTEKDFAAAVQAQDRVIANLRAIIEELEGRRLAAQDWDARLARVKATAAAIRALRDEQRALNEASRGDVRSSAETGALEAFARTLEDLAEAQRRLADKLPEGPLPEEAALKALAGRVAALRGAQEALRARTEGAPPEADLAPLRQQAEALLGRVARSEINADTRKGMEDLAAAAESVLGDQALAEEPRAAAALDDDARRRNGARALRQTRDRTAKGAALAPFAPEQADLGLQARELARAAADGADGRRAAEEASEALKSAAQAMERAVRSLQAGEGRQAAEGQERASAELGKAEKSLAGAAEALGRRDRFERAQAVQEGIEGKAAALARGMQDQAARLQRKDRAQPLSDAARALDRAGEAMRQASASFGERREAGIRQAGEAARELAAAKNALKEEALKQLKRHDLEKAARAQEELARKTKATARGLKEQSDGVLKRAGDRVDRAGGRMDRAAQDFQAGEGERGANQQKEAEEELARAAEEVGQEEEELARLKQEEALTNMVVLLVKLRDGERDVLGEILKAEEARTDGKLPRNVRHQLRQVAQGHAGLMEEGEQVRRLLDDEKARVFAFLVEDVLGDMAQIKEALGREDTGAYTQMLVVEVIAKLEKLLAALKNELAQRQEERPQDRQGQQRLVLVPPVAEALMLRDMQFEINAQTEALESARVANDGKLNEVMERQLTRLALKQGALGGLTKRLAKDFFGILPGENANEPAGKE